MSHTKHYIVMVLSQLYIDHRDETRNDEIHFIKLERSGEQHG